MRTALLTVLVLALAGCGDAAPTQVQPEITGITAGSLAVTMVSDGFDVMNQTERPVFLAVFEADYATLVDLYPCTTNGPGCQSLGPGEHRQYKWTSIGGYGPAKSEYVLFWWYAETGADGQLHPSGLTTIGVRT